MFNGMWTSGSFVMLISLMQTAIIMAAVGTETASGKEPILELYMHDILEESSPTEKPVTDLLGNVYSGQVPFAKQLGFLSPAGGVAIPNANGAFQQLLA